MTDNRIRKAGIMRRLFRLLDIDFVREPGLQSYRRQVQTRHSDTAVDMDRFEWVLVMVSIRRFPRIGYL
jgi:hypothetical protein